MKQVQRRLMLSKHVKRKQGTSPDSIPLRKETRPMVKKVSFLLRWGSISERGGVQHGNKGNAGEQNISHTLQPRCPHGHTAAEFPSSTVLKNMNLLRITHTRHYSTLQLSSMQKFGQWHVLLIFIVKVSQHISTEDTLLHILMYNCCFAYFILTNGLKPFHSTFTLWYSMPNICHPHF